MTLGRAVRTLLAAATFALSAPAAAVWAGPPAPLAAAGQEHEIRRSYESSRQGETGGSSRSRGEDIVVERVLEIGDAGVELQYDLPQSATPEDRVRAWQFPVRVFRPADGPPRIVDWAELDARLGRWLTAAGLTRAACGRHHFTWNAFRIDCEPHAVLAQIAAFDLPLAALREGVRYDDPDARRPVVLTRARETPQGAALVAVLDADPEVVRQAQAQVDVIAGEVTNEPLTLEAAMGRRAKDTVAGTIATTLDVDGDGRVWRRTRVTRLQTTTPDGRSETQTRTETVERRPLSPGTSGAPR